MAARLAYTISMSNEEIVYTPGFSTLSIETVVDSLPLKQDTIRLYGRWLRVPRLTSWHGEGSYTFSGRTMQAAPFPAVLESLRKKVSEAAGVEFNSCLANYYRDGSDSVNWHADNEPELGPTPDNVVIASLSFGDVRRFLIRPKGNPGCVREFRLEPGSLLIMRGSLQQTHEHSVPKTRIPRDPRLNLTFRVRV
jgi:alkylated DNA repair dioxygenase AlkB